MIAQYLGYPGSCRRSPRARFLACDNPERSLLCSAVPAPHHSRSHSHSHSRSHSHAHPHAHCHSHSAGTAGTQFHDYVILDRHLAPVDLGARHLSEFVALLPVTYHVNAFPLHRSPAHTHLAPVFARAVAAATRPQTRLPCRTHHFFALGCRAVLRRLAAVAGAMLQGAWAAVPRLPSVQHTAAPGRLGRHDGLPHPAPQPPVTPPPATLGELPSDAFVLVCFNQGSKMDPAVVRVWMGVLRRVPRAVLWVLSGAATGAATPAVAEPGPSVRSLAGSCEPRSDARAVF